MESLGINPDTLIATHPHGDRINGLPALRQRYPEARVVIGPGAREFLAHPETAAALVAEDRFMSEFLASQGTRPGRPPIDRPPSVDGATVVSDSETLDLGGLAIRFLHVGGHAIGNVLVHVPGRSALMVSDSLGFRIPSVRFFPNFLHGIWGLPGHDRPPGSPRAPNPMPGPPGAARWGGRTEGFQGCPRGHPVLYEEIRNDPRDEDTVIQELYPRFYRDELALYTPENIIGCCRLIIRRSRA